MTITLSISPGLEGVLRSATPDLDYAAKEALLVSLYRHGQLSQKQLSDGLELERWGTGDVLKRHNVTEDLPTINEVREQADLSLALRKSP